MIQVLEQEVDFLLQCEWIFDFIDVLDNIKKRRLEFGVHLT